MPPTAGHLPVALALALAAALLATAARGQRRVETSRVSILARTASRPGDACTVTGRVVLARPGQATLSVCQGGWDPAELGCEGRRPAPVKADGRFEVRPAPGEGPVTLLAEAPGHEEARLRLDLGRDCGVRAELRLAAVRSRAPVLLTVERGPCEGRCPAYRVRVHADGVVEWHGFGFVEASGQATGQLDPEALAELGRALEGLGSWPEDAPAFEGACADAPRVTLSWRAGPGERRLTRWPGCQANDEGAFLRTLERLERLAGVARWVGPRR